MVSGAPCLTLPALREVLLYRKRQQTQSLYTAHLTWLIGAQLFTLGGGHDYPVPDVLSLLPDETLPRDRRTAGQVRQSILNQLTHSVRKEATDG